ncbi:MAG TPA: ABC transporter ATP-binding protein [Candidatus Limnocylindria bacterium]|nr:ABC transporter ATP-binding protein [Candidatus Limnocylindria bacterium]
MSERGGHVELRGLAVRYPSASAAAVDGVDLTIKDGTFAVLLGPSGCGKSTLLRTINRLVEPTAGTVLLDGVDVRERDATELRRGIGYVIQAVGLFPHYTVAQNVGVVPALLGWDKARIARRVDELLALVSLEPARYRERKPRQLSGGEAQRVGVARALAAEPRLLLMDEPFAAVDAIVRASLQDQIARVHRELGTTIVFVTHDVDEALRLADRIVVMNAGRVVQHDAPATLLEHPADPFVRDLVGVDAETRRLALERPLVSRA